MSTKDDDVMSPDASPGEQSNKPGVRRVNNVPLYIAGGGLAAFLLIMLLVAADRAEKQNAPVEVSKQTKAGDTESFAKGIVGNRSDGIVQAKTPPLVMPPADSAAGSVGIARPPINLDQPPLPPDGQGMQPPTSQQQQMDQMAQMQQRSPAEERADQVRTARLQQLDQAVRARSSVAFGSAQSGVTNAGMASAQNMGTPGSAQDTLAKLAAVRQQLQAVTATDPVAAYKARLQQAQGIVAGMSGGGGAGAGGSGGGSGNAMQGSPAGMLQGSGGKNDVAQFSGQEQGNRWSLNSEVEGPPSPYVLQTGWVIPAKTISGINSELPGQIIAQVSQDVYDSPRSQHKLIPQGSRLVGRYSSDVAYGQSRVLIGWQRIIFPDGRTLDIGSMPASDGAGYAGLSDKVNNHYFRLFGSAFLMSAVTAGITLSQPDDSTNGRPTARSAMSEALGQQLGQVTAQVISKNLNISPTLEIRPGFRFNVTVTKDMVFPRPYKAFDY